MIRSGMRVSVGQKIGDIDPRGAKDACYRISDKARAIGTGALKALMAFRVRMVQAQGGSVHLKSDV